MNIDRRWMILFAVTISAAVGGRQIATQVRSQILGERRWQSRANPGSHGTTRGELLTTQARARNRKGNNHD
jgi:hypothetical protein